ncbi:MAG: 30S ribosomal protein S21 [Chitinophagales bacterium]|nr:30S ribosomal protein S21 [Chitinophagales bacterium]
MLIIDAREMDSLDKALKAYKKKHDRAKVMKEVRDRQYFSKPSVKNREQRLKAIYREQILRIEE